LGAALIIIKLLCRCSETNDVNTGLLIEVWNKGMIWDRALGYYYMPLTEVQYSNEVSHRNALNSARNQLPFMFLRQNSTQKKVYINAVMFRNEKCAFLQNNWLGM